MKHYIILLGILLLISVGCKTDCDCSIVAYEAIKYEMTKVHIETKILKTKAVRVGGRATGRYNVAHIYHTYKCSNSSDIIELGYSDDNKVYEKHFNDNYYPK